MTLGEGMTPMVPLPAYGAAVGVPGLLMKDEGLVPTGSFKARGAAVGVSRARELGVRAVDAQTVEITLENPTGYFLELMTHYTSFPVPKHVVEQHGPEWVKPGTFVSNGAFHIVE